MATHSGTADLSTLVVSWLRFNRPAAVPHAAPTAVAAAAAAAAAAQVEKPLHCQKFLTRTTTKLFSGGHNINKHALVVANGCGVGEGQWKGRGVLNWQWDRNVTSSGSGCAHVDPKGPSARLIGPARPESGPEPGPVGLFVRFVL